MTRDEAIRKATALLRLAGRAGTPGEAAAAASRAQSIMDFYELSRGSLDEHQADAQDGELRTFGDAAEGYVDTTSRWVAWRSHLLDGIARLHGCFSWRSCRGEGASYEIAGRPASVETVRYFYGWISGEVARITDEHGRGMGKVWRREFSEGAVAEIVKRLNAQRQESARAMRSENSAALMVINNSLARIEHERGEASLFAHKEHKLRSGGSRFIQHNDSARASGQRAARDVNLSRASGALASGRRRIGS